jgi:pimeloyl-ACP methyl ester carboxylesterase
MFTEKIFDSGTIKINYAEGTPNGAPLVTLHGDTARWQELNPLFNELEKDWHLYACDKRGHGKSSWGESYRVVDIASDISDFIERNIGEPVILIGHSGGAVASLVTATQIPELIKSLIVIDPPIRLREESVKGTYVYNYFLNVYDITTHKRTAREVISEMFPDMDEEGRQYLEDTFSTLDPEFVKTHLEDRYLDGMDTQAVLEKITCPTLMLYGEIDKGGVVRDRDAEFFRAHIPNGKAIQIKDAGHLIHLDQLERMVELINQWLKALK